MRADQDPRDDIETAWEILALMRRDWERGDSKVRGDGKPIPSPEVVVVSQRLLLSNEH